LVKLVGKTCLQYDDMKTKKPAQKLKNKMEKKTKWGQKT